MKSFKFVSLICIVVALTLAACTSPAPQAAETQAPVSQTALTIAGSGGAATVLKYLANAYGEQHSNTTFEFLSGSSSGGGVKGALDGSLDLGVMSRAAKSSELESGVEYLPFASDQIIVATNSDMGISELTGQQMKDIFLGNITNWSEVGGPNAGINVLVRDEDESSTQVLRSLLFGDAAFANGSIVFTSEGELRDALTNSPNAIAFMSFGGLRLSDKNFPVLKIDGMDPANLSNNYPYFRPLGVAYVKSNMEKIQPFLDFLTSPEGRALLAEKGVKPPQ
jgi:phosphate transport system substrate-binding protein